MPQSPPSQPPTQPDAASSPTPPIFVLGRENGYIVVAGKVAEAVKLVSGDLLMVMGGTNRLSLSDLDFFDATGRPLVPVASSGMRWDDLVVRDHRDEIRDRVRRLFHEAEPALTAAGDVDAAVLKLPDEDIDFDAFTREMAVALRPRGLASRRFHKLFWNR